MTSRLAPDTRVDVVLSGKAVAETYSVLTRPPGDAKLSAPYAARLMRERFGPPLVMSPDTWRRLPDLLSGMGLAGGAVYDALVALPTLQQGADLATRDARARGTYERVGVRVVPLD